MATFLLRASIFCRSIRPYQIAITCLLCLLLICNQVFISLPSSGYKTRLLQQQDKYEEFIDARAYEYGTRGNGEAPPQIDKELSKHFFSPWDKIQLQRREHITSVCKNASSQANSLYFTLKHSRLLRDSVVVDHRHHVLYCAIPKAACSSWRSALAVLTGKINLRESEKLHHVHDLSFMASIGIHPLLSLARSEESLELLRHLHRMIVVRHPFERLVSAFRDKFESFNKWTRHFQKTYGRDIISRYRKSPSRASLEKGDDVSFPEFVQWLLDPAVDPEFKFNPHWASYQDLCQPCLIDYDHIIDFNTFQQDTSEVLSKIFGVENAEKFFPYRNAHSVNTKVIELEYLNQLSSRTITRLYDLYEIDFAMFNYTWPR